MRVWIVPIQATESIVLFGTREGLQSIGFEYLHLLLGLRELGLAILRQFEPALVRSERLLKGELPRLHAGDQLFQLGQRGFEAERLAGGGRWLGRFCHDRNKTL